VNPSDQEETNMKFTAISALLLSLLAFSVAQAEEAQAPSPDATVQIIRSGTQPSAKGSGDYFTGPVRVDPLFRARPPSPVSGGLVTFEPGSRSAWHSHPLGQVLIVTAGLGWVQQWGGPIQEMRPGDIVRIPPGVKHWHGATATTAVTHIAITEELNGKNTEWLEKVSDEQYEAKPKAPGN
jgi:quercetin dioxygenase-like cupin family protein